MKNGTLKVLCVTTALAMLVAFGAPQLGKRKGETNGGGTTTTGGSSTGGTTGGGGGGSTGGSGGGGGLGRRSEPPPVRTTTGGGGQRREERGTTGGGGGGGVIIGGGSTGGGGVIIGGNGGRQESPLGGRRRESRSGVVRYGESNNGAGRIEVNGLRIERPPQVINPGMQRRIGDSERIGLVYNGYRVGYYHYDRRWSDDYFAYPHYVFNPWQSNRYVCSPWYYYPSLPPYVNSTRIIVINSGWPSYNWVGSPYRYQRPDRYDRWNNASELDYAITDILDSFERNDMRAVNRLIPNRGNVHIYFDGRYSYSMHPDDFYDLYVDGIENVRTTRYSILDVERNGRGVRVLAKHEFVDPWNRRSFNYHQYFLEEEGRGYVIREFGTSYQRPW